MCTASSHSVRPQRYAVDSARTTCNISFYFFLFFFFKQKTAYEIGLGIPAEPLFRSAEAVKILIFAAEGLTKRSAVGFLLRSLIMFQTFISRHNSNFFSDKLVLTSVTPASSAPVLQTPKATSSTLYFDSLTVNAG